MSLAIISLKLFSNHFDCFWAFQPLVPFYPGMCGLSLVPWTLSWIYHWLAPTLSSVPPFPLYSLQERQIAGQMFLGWIGVPVYLLEVLCGYRRKLVQALYPHY